MANHKAPSNTAVNLRRAGTVATAAPLALAIGASPAMASHEWDVIAKCESGNTNAENPTSTASGFFQIIDGTWAANGGLEFGVDHASEASYDQQLTVAQNIAENRGSLADWNASKHCWGDEISSAVPKVHATAAPKKSPKAAPKPAAETPKPKKEKPKAEKPKTEKAPVEEASVEYDTYTVVRGDTLFKIGGQFDKDWREIAELNGIDAPYLIDVGQVLKIAEVEQQTYEVEEGDWLSTIAPQFDMTTQELYEDNREVIGDNPDLIFPGQVFFVSGLPLAQAPATVEETPARQDDEPEEAAVEEKADKVPVEKKADVSAGVAHPMPGAIRTSGYGSRWGEFHDGIDFDCAIGDPAFAAADGYVETSEFNEGGYGNWVRVRHADGSLTFYAHLDSRSVQADTYVLAGQEVGRCGNTGHVVSSTGDGSHLHFGAEAGPGLTMNPDNWASQRGLTL